MEKLINICSEIKLQEEEEEVGEFKQCGTYDKIHFEEWKRQNDEWEENKKKKIGEYKEELERMATESMRSLYKPRLYKNSESILKSQISNNESYENRFEKLYNSRLIKEQNLSKLMVKSLPTFSPKINNKPSLLKNQKNFSNYSMISSKNFIKQNPNLSMDHLKSNRTRNSFQRGSFNDININSSVTNIKNHYISSFEENESLLNIQKKKKA